MVLLKVYLLPIFFAIFSILTFVITYIVSVLLGHVSPVFPYISDTGAFPPESSLFSLLVNIGLIYQVACVGLRYMQLEEARRVLAEDSPRHLRNCNIASGVIAGVAVLGIALLANFQKSTVRPVHGLGAGMYFFCTTVYFCFQTYFSWRFISEITPRHIVYCRYAIMCITIPLTFAIPALGMTSKRRFKGQNVYKWGPEDGGYELHIASVVCEWILVFCHSIYFGTFASDFRYMTINYPILHVNISAHSASTEMP